MSGDEPAPEPLTAVVLSPELVAEWREVLAGQHDDDVFEWGEGLRVGELRALLVAHARAASLERELAEARETSQRLNRRVGELESQLARDDNERCGGFRRDCLELTRNLDTARERLARAESNLLNARTEAATMRRWVELLRQAHPTACDGGKCGACRWCRMKRYADAALAFDYSQVATSHRATQEAAEQFFGCKGAVPVGPELEAQRRSWAFGNANIENPAVTRELVDEVADDMAAGGEKGGGNG